MQDRSVTEFSGVAGRLLWHSLSPSSLITGTLIGFNLMFFTWVLTLARAPLVSTFFTQIVIAWALARFAKNGYFGEWDGTVFSSAGGPWSEVLVVTLRYLALTAVWLIPLTFIGFGMNDPEKVQAMVMAGGSKIMIFLGLYMLLSTLTPPVFLIVSVSAEDFSGIFSPEHWRTMFQGRLADLFAVYAIYTGALGMILLLAVGPIMMAFGVNVWLGVVGLGATFCGLFGVSLSLLGRLCGFYACGDVALPATDGESDAPVKSVDSDSAPTPQPTPQPTPEPTAEAPAIDMPAIAPEPTASLPPTPEPPPIQAPQPAAAVFPPFPQAGNATAAEPPQAPRARTTPEVHFDVDGDLVARIMGGEAARRTPLLDARRRVEESMLRFRLDPSHTLSTLTDLAERFAPSAHVLQALAVCLYRTSHVEEALQVARLVLPMCFEHGQNGLAAQLFVDMKSRVDGLKLSRDQLLAIAATLAADDELGAAAQAYSLLVRRDPDEIPAIKGLLQVAERILHEREKPDAAARVYRYLLEHCETSPLAEYMREGLDEAEKALESVS